MHIERIYIQRNFQVEPGGNEFLYGNFGMGIFINEGENVGDAIEEAEKQIKEYIARNTRYPEHNHIEVRDIRDIQVQPNLPQATSLIDDIRSCTEVKVLESYKLLVKNNITLRQVYNEKLEELTKQSKPTT